MKSTEELRSDLEDLERAAPYWNWPQINLVLLIAWILLRILIALEKQSKA